MPQSLRRPSIYEGLETIASSAFARCDSLAKVRLPESIRSLWPRVFEHCSKLVEINLPEGLEWIDPRTFGGCESLCTVSMPLTMKKIGSNAFEDCASLVHLHLNEGLRCIGEFAFKHCSSLSAIALPSSLEEIESNTFSNCVGLVGFEIPADSIAAIPNDCFDWCRSLVNVSIPPAVSDGCLRLLPVHGSDAWNRYDHLPIHKLCYKSTHTTTDELMQALTLPGMLGDDMSKDTFGMTPFHIVATSSKLRSDMLECLLNHYESDLLWEKDNQGFTMMDYLLRNRSSKAFHLLKMAIYKLCAPGICSTDHRGGERFDLLDESKVVSWHDDKTRQRLVKEMLGHVGYYYRIETTRSLVELALWKMKMDELQVDSNFIDRASCRYRFGAEDVVKSVATYLWDQELHAYYTAISTHPQLDFYKVHPDPDFDSESSETGSYAETVWPDTDSSDSSSSDESGEELDSSSSSSSESSGSEESSETESDADSFF